MPIKDALAEMDRVKGTQLDKDICEVFIKMVQAKTECIEKIINMK